MGRAGLLAHAVRSPVLTLHNVDNVAPMEVSAPALVTVASNATVASVLRDRAAEFPDRTYCEYKDTSGDWVPISLKDFAERVADVAKGLIAFGVGRGDTVALMAATRYEWALLDMAIMTAGALTVPLYPSSSRAQVEWIVEDASLALVIVETARMAQQLEGVTHLPRVLTIDGEDGALDALTRAGNGVSDEDLRERTAHAHLDDIASIVYTSGTTGNPKGVELTHRNFVEHAMNAAAYPDLYELTQPGSRLLLFLPLAHVLARHLEILSLVSGMTIGFSPSPATLANDLKSFKPHWIIAVPRVLEAFYNTVDARTGGGVKQRLFRWAAGVSRRVAYRKERGRVGPLLTGQLVLAHRLVLHKIREAMGGQLRFIVCGGARLSREYGAFYAGVGVAVLQGYGLTESAAPSTCNPQTGSRLASVGPPLPGCAVRIASDGEVLLKGPNIFAGYRHAPELTAEVMKDGWFATGDLGSIDDAGHLIITGRKKEIIVLDAGKNVQPASLEDAIRPDPLVQEVVVIGDGKAYIAALISLDEAMLPGWLQQHGLARMTVAEAAQHPAVLAHVASLVKRANERVSSIEAIRKFRIVPRALTEADGEFSASLKVRRHVVIDHFSDLVDELYPRRGR